MTPVNDSPVLGGTTCALAGLGELLAPRLRVDIGGNNGTSVKVGNGSYRIAQNFNGGKV